MTDRNRIKTFLWIALFFLSLSLYGYWEKEHTSVPVQKPVADISEVPTIVFGHQPIIQESDFHPVSSMVTVETDTFKAKIDLKGGDLVYTELKKYASQARSDVGVVLLDNIPERYSVAQSGLIGVSRVDSSQDGRVVFKSPQSTYVLQSDKLEIPLSWNSPDGIKIHKTYTFWPGKYLVDVAYRVQNQSKQDWIGHFYGQIVQKPEIRSSSWGMQTYYGGAVYTPKKPYKQISFDKMREKPFEQDITGGWAAIAQHYFLTAWVFPVHEEFKYFAKGVTKGRISIGAVGDAVLIKPGEEKSLNASLYIGPEDASVLKTISPGLDLTVDYGFLWPISKFLFWVMKQLYSLIGNWGWVIIAITVIIKLSFYKLSASSYHSMGKMRKIQPRLSIIKERCGDDKQRFSQEMIELYRSEKVNPLGGCFPILIQIPVFIALYYVLLENVEFRHAPFMFWVQDLSSKDPFYVLPLLMGVTMIIQQKLSPPPPDPIQAKVMMLMPVLFTVLFLQFPAGLTLYWFVNNLLSITQQWVILKRLD